MFVNTVDSQWVEFHMYFRPLATPKILNVPSKKKNLQENNIDSWVFGKAYKWRFLNHFNIISTAIPTFTVYLEICSSISKSINEKQLIVNDSGMKAVLQHYKNYRK